MQRMYIAGTEEEMKAVGASGPNGPDVQLTGLAMVNGEVLTFKPPGIIILAFDVPEDVAAKYRMTDVARGVEQWRIPAAVLHAKAAVSIVTGISQPEDN